MDPALTGSARLRDQPDHPSPPLMFGPLEGRLLQDDKPAVQHHQQSAHSHQQFPVSSVGQNMISMPFIKRHVRRRLANAKETCDKDLRKVMHSITTYVEDKLRESAIEFDLDDSPHLVEHYHRHSQFFQQDDGSDDGGDEADREYLGPQDPGQHSRHESVSSSPNSLRRHSTLPRSSIVPSGPMGELSPGRKPSMTNANAGWQSGSTTGLGRRVSRNIHIPSRPAPSNTSSRSTSRSRSPMPPTMSGSFTDSGGPTSSPVVSTNRRLSRIELDVPDDSFMTVLHEIIALATDIVEMPISTLTSRPQACVELVQRVQTIGKAWDEHPDWHGRNWYVQLLLAVAGLSRVVEWWEAEKQFWNFEEDNEDAQPEPLTFVMKGVRDTPEQSQYGDDDAQSDSRSIRSRSVTGELPKEPTPPPAIALQGERAPAAEEPTPETSHAEDTEKLRQQAEEAQSLNIVLELSLDRQEFLWINPAWSEVFGTDGDDLVRNPTSIASLLAPEDRNAYESATKKLLEDDSHTVQFSFRMKADPNRSTKLSEPSAYRLMEGFGMLMHDRNDGSPTHTMWVLKSLATQEDLGPEVEIGDLVSPGPLSAGPGFHRRAGTDPITPFPFSRPISTAPILCRICECQVPNWFFEKHSETCNEVHRLEAAIGECNESIAELRSTIRDLAAIIERSSPLTVPEYRGQALVQPSPPLSSSALQIFRPPLSSRMQRNSIRKLQRKLVAGLNEILQLAWEISVPSLKEDQAAEPIERQRLLSPESLDKITAVQQWIKPTSDDPALARLIDDAYVLMRTKLDNVNRMQNTIKYSEKVRQEWEEKVERTLTSLAEEEEAIDEAEMGSHSSTTSEYAFEGELRSSDPTPIRAASPASPPSRGSGGSGEKRSPALLPFNTRSSTPSSVSSPLALAIPIVASPEPIQEIDTSQETTPSHPTSRDFVLSSAQTIRARRSAQNLIIEPRFLVTPPLSPLGSPKDSRAHRRHSTVHPILSPTAMVGPGPLSPRIPSVAPSSRTTPSSIKDFEIIKPISKGAFGSVFLAKKKVTGDYYAIKVLRKADMIAKNQITNVKAERMILMTQAESPFVVKLYFTFQSKDNLYLVMEYLNGGDCAALIKTLGSLPEEWTRAYIAEVILGLEHLHDRGVVHRDLKPDNLLIDEHGHLKLTDFGLSRIGLLNRQTREEQRTHQSLLGLDKHGKGHMSQSARSPSMDSTSHGTSVDSIGSTSNLPSYFGPRTVPQLAGASTDDVSESSGSESFSGLFWKRPSKPLAPESPLQSFATDLTNDLRSHISPGSGTPPADKFVGTPDYLAPESILGISSDDRVVDWWALGVITYEFLYGVPPFNADTPAKVFDNIISRRIDWHEDWVDFSPEARDFMERLMTTDPKQRLGYNGAQEVKNHPFLRGVEWDKVATTEAQFVPQVSDPESTDYFDPRGAIPQLFDEEPIAITGRIVTDSPKDDSAFATKGTPSPITKEMKEKEKEEDVPANDDFGSFAFKNLPVLKQANDDVIRKLRSDQLSAIGQALAEPAVILDRRRSLSQKVKQGQSIHIPLENRNFPTNPPSPSTSTSSIGSSPRANLPPLVPTNNAGHLRRPSEYSPLERFKHNHMDSDGTRRNSMPSRLRTASMSSSDHASVSEDWQHSRFSTQDNVGTPATSIGSTDLRRLHESQKLDTDTAITCLLADDNPISLKILETLLTRMGCRCVLVADGAEAISVALGDIRFDCILMDYHMPNVDGETAARYIHNTPNKNKNTPIVVVSAYSGQEANPNNPVFAASLMKPVQKSDLIGVMRQLGFKISTQEGGRPTSKLLGR